MKSEKRNLTLAIDEDLLARVRVIAAQRRTTVTEIVRRHLQGLAAADAEHEKARRWLEVRMNERPLRIDRMWSREELHER